MFKLFTAIALRRVSQPNIRTREALRSHRKVLLMGTFSVLTDDDIFTAVGRREVSSLTTIFTDGGATQYCRMQTASAWKPSHFKTSFPSCKCLESRAQRWNLSLMSLTAGV